MPGQNELAQSAAATRVPRVEEKNRLGRSGRDKDYLYVAEGLRSFSGEKINLKWDKSRHGLTVESGNAEASYTSPVITCKFPALDFLPSWNIRLPDARYSFKVYLRVADKNRENFSPWLFLGEGGSSSGQSPVETEDAGWGKCEIDYLHLTRPAHAFQYKVTFSEASSAEGVGMPCLQRFFTHYSGTAQKPVISVAAARPRQYRVPVPYRSQLDLESEELRHIVCCPTCVAMVLESNGINKPTAAVCEDVFDKRTRLYGLWPRASQAAFQNGCRAWVQRFRSLDEVRTYLVTTGRPIIASIRVQPGELRGARYPDSQGHLIVITGYEGKNTIRVNDPYSVGPSGGEIEYLSADIDKVWLDKGGVAILIEPEKSDDQKN